MLSRLKALLAQVDRGAWIRFFGALVGLALAFALALFSTVFREAGNLWGTAAMASLALLLAGVVGLATVPYLARRVVVARVREVFDYDVTRQGLVYLGMALVIGIAALNTGNNLLFIVLAAMLAAIIISGAASAAQLRGLRLETVLPAQGFAGRTVSALVKLENTRRLAPAFSVSVVPPRARRRARRKWVPDVFVFPPNRPPGKEWVRWNDLHWKRIEAGSAARQIFEGSVYFPYLPPGTAASASVELNFARRGLYRQEALGLSTRFPFAFLKKTRRIALRPGSAAGREIVVFPSVEPTDELLDVLPMIRGEFEIFVRGRGHDLYRIREYMPEDSARHVDWKASARSQSLKVREFTREDERRLRIIFDNPRPGVAPEAAYERGVTMAASLAWHFAGESREPLLGGPVAELSFVAPGYGGSNEVFDFLHYLALVEPGEGESVLDTLPLGTDDFNVIITARQHGSVPTALWATSYLIFMAEA